MSNNEITVRAKYTDEKLDEFLSESGFRKLNKYYFTDVFLIPSEINIYDNNVRDILKKAITAALEEVCNAYDEACMKYLDNKVDKKRFKKTYIS